ncbi:MAG: prolyl-tRNA synthetase, partial [Candidatus Arcticimaribacter sp.]
ATKEGGLEHVWASSWGVSTRLMGALIMTHSDDSGLVLPPNLAPIQVVIVPIHKGEEQLTKIAKVAHEIKEQLQELGVSVKFDDRDNVKPGFKFNDYELKGVPLRIAIGPKDLEKNQVELARRDTLSKSFVPKDELAQMIPKLLNEIQETLFNKAEKFRDEHITEADNFDAFKEILNSKGGFVSAHWDGTSETEDQIKKATKATIRCIPYTSELENGTCIFSGKPSTQRVLFAKAY